MHSSRIVSVHKRGSGELFKTPIYPLIFPLTP